MSTNKPKTPKDSHYARLRRAHRDIKAGDATAASRRQRLEAAAEPAPDGMVRLYGLHTVRAAIDNPRRRIDRMLATRNALQRLGLGEQPGLHFPVELVEPRAIDRLVGSDAVHQGALIEARPLPTRKLSALDELHALGFQTIGLDSDGPAELEATFAGERIALVLGAEGKGLRQKTRETVSALARIDMPGAIRSLNVSNAAAVALYAARRYLAARAG